MLETSSLSAYSTQAKGSLPKCARCSSSARTTPDARSGRPLSPTTTPKAGGGPASGRTAGACRGGGLAEIGLDASAEFPKPLTDDVVRAADVVITVGCGGACPVYVGKRYLDWDLPDLVGRAWLRCTRSVRWSTPACVIFWTSPSWELGSWAHSTQRPPS
ncbi:hypothetical protein GCM10022224_095200 [Nonomuraea antimicrobica]|uniref:Uncharacterized protein n=1 Tax=Nonomuraea antimicrobica TaxID=561173 RepID=A0ABP7E7M9_9ACTN